MDSINIIILERLPEYYITIPIGMKIYSSLSPDFELPTIYRTYPVIYMFSGDLPSHSTGKTTDDGYIRVVNGVLEYDRVYFQNDIDYEIYNSYVLFQTKTEMIKWKLKNA